MMTEKFPKLLLETKSQTLEAQKIPSRINSKNATPGHIFKIQISKVKKKKRC